MNRFLFAAALIAAIAAVPAVAAPSWTGTVDVLDGEPRALFRNNDLQVEVVCATQGTEVAVQVSQRGKEPGGATALHWGGAVRADNAWWTVRSMVPGVKVSGLEPLARKFFADACSIKA